MSRKPVGRCALTLLGCLLAPLAFSVSCSPAPSPSPPREPTASQPAGAGSTAAQTWDRDALASAQPCLLALDTESARGLSAVALDGRVVATGLWLSPRNTAVTLLDADPSGPRIALGVADAPAATPALISESIVLLDRDGTAITASQPPTAFPLVSGATFLDSGDLLWARRLETRTSVETTLGLFDSHSKESRPVTLTGEWPRHRFIAGLVPLRANDGTGTSVAVVLKTDGTPGPRDDFAVVTAEYRAGELTARSAPFRDDALFTMSQGPTPNTLVFARAATEGSSVADEIVVLKASGRGWISAVLLDDARCDPGFDFDRVCAGGPNGSVLFRAAVPPTGTPVPARLEQLPVRGSHARATGVIFPGAGDQWIWLMKPRL